MIYKLASRDNIDHERFESWPAVLNINFTKFNNTVEEPIFHTEDEALNWLESRSRTKSATRSVNVQEFRNGDPNKIYSLYVCDHNDQNHLRVNCLENIDYNDRFLYSLRFRRAHETYTMFTNEKGSRVKSSFKKIDNGIDNAILFQFTPDYSSDVRLIKQEYIEGIYPIENDEKDKIHAHYVKFVKDIHEKDTDEGKKQEYSVVFANSGFAARWLHQFIKKLEQVEKYLELFAKGGSIYVNIGKDSDHNDLMRYMFKLLTDNRLDTPEDDSMQSKIRNMMIDPYLVTNEIYQVRYNKTLISWHKNYVHMIKKLNLIPSKQFSDLIMNFSLMDFFKQFHSKDNIESMISNIKEIYGINDGRNTASEVISFIRKKSRDKPKFFKVVKKFN
jgi:hypothetical protein